jgi:mono/diheme cytochrome c family protein
VWARSACTACHGTDAQGTAAGPALAQTPLTIHGFTSIVRRGGPGMPKYHAAQVSDQALEDIFAWLANAVPAPTAAPGENPWPQSGCAGCHVVNAEGGTGPALAGTQQPFARFQSFVRQGGPSMPAFSAAQISDPALQALYAWLQGQAPAQQQNPWVLAGCGGCHGANAEGGSAPGLTGERVSFSRLQRIVRGGGEGMPAYDSSQLSDPDLQAIYEWLMARP